MTQNSKSKGMTRRGFAAAVALTGPSAKLLAQDTSNSDSPREPKEISPFQETLAFSRKEAPANVQPFPMKAVRLAPGPFHDAQEWNRSVLRRLPVDRLVRNFRVNAVCRLLRSR
jgi:hypothetical protein